MGSCCCGEKDHHNYGGNYGSFGDGDSTNEMGAYEDSDRDSTNAYERASDEDSDRDSTNAYERASDEDSDRDSTNAYERASYEDSDRDSTNAYERASDEDSDRDSTNAYERASDEDSDRDSTNAYERASYEDSDRDSTSAYGRASYEDSDRGSTSAYGRTSYKYEASDRESTNAYERTSDRDSTSAYGRASYEDSDRGSTNAYGRTSYKYEASDRESTDEMANSADGVETSGKVSTDRAGSSCPVDVTRVVARALRSQADPSEVRRAKAAVAKIRFRIVGTETTHFKLTLGLEASRFDGLVERFCKRYGLDDHYKESLLDGKYSYLNENFVEKFYFTVNEMGGVVSGVFVSRKVSEETYDVACAVYSVKLKVTERSLTYDEEEHLKTYFTDKARRALFVQYPALN